MKPIKLRKLVLDNIYHYIAKSINNSIMRVLTAAMQGYIIRNVERLTHRSLGGDFVSRSIKQKSK
jgi:hypothetical protein